MNLYSPTSVATDMDIDKTPADEEADDAVTSKASKSARFEFIWSTRWFIGYPYGFLCLLQFHETLLCSRTMKKKYR